MRKYFILILLSICTILGLSQCGSEPKEETKAPTLASGIWRGLIDVQGQSLWFNFEVKSNDSSEVYAELINAGERILISPEDISFYGDSVKMIMHIFDTEIRAKIGEGKLTGLYSKNYAPYTLPFEATLGESHRVVKPDVNAGVAALQERYMVTFVHESDTTPAVGEFSQKGNHVTGTFLTETGDYRFLEGGIVDEDQLVLTAYDGNHAFVFEATIAGDSLVEGHFWSGASWHETWTAVADPEAALRDANSLTYLREGYDRISFAFPDLNGDTVTLEDPKYAGKAVVLQIFGTWCPNCLDETLFYRDWYAANKDKDVAIIGLAYEQKADFDYASNRVKKMKERMNVGYDFLIAGTSDKKAAAETLPMINHVMSFPTSIFINKDGEVVKIHTGFSGPGTGAHYDRFVEDFNSTMGELLAE